jgi:hypothetical protein
MLNRLRLIFTLLILIFTSAILADNAIQSNITTKIHQESHKNPTYEIKMAVPVMQGQAPYVQSFNQYVKSLMEKERREFIDSIAGDVPPNPSAFDLKYKILYFIPNRFVSIQFEEYSYVSGSAHPNIETYVINYDFVQNRDLNLQDLFKPEVSYLSIIANYCIKELKTRKFGAVDFIKDGAAPVDRNYHDWNITKAGLLINFDAYQVAPYVYGKQTVVIPYSYLKPYMKEEYIKLLNIQ